MQLAIREAFERRELGALGLRKRLRTRALGKLAYWVQAHSILGGAIFGLTLFCLIFLGDGLRDALDPKSSKD